MNKIIILEGIDGTGKTTLASMLVEKSSLDNPISYLYFPKLESIDKTISYWVKEFEKQIIQLSQYTTVVVDRSIISTVVYHNLKPKLLHSLIKLPRDRTFFVLLTKLHQNKEKYSKEKISKLMNNYHNAFSVLRQDSYLTLQGSLPGNLLHLLLSLMSS